MDNITYEFFIRRCWDCDRFKHGADTDIWEDLVIKYINLENANVGNFQITQKEFENKLVEVKAYLDAAYNQLLAMATKKKINPTAMIQLIKSRAIVASSSEPKEIFDALKAIFTVINDNNL